MAQRRPRRKSKSVHGHEQYALRPNYLAADARDTLGEQTVHAARLHADPVRPFWAEWAMHA
jgi:hypothetical protein